MPHSKWLLTVSSNFDIDDSNSSSKKIGKLWINSVVFVRPQTILCGAVESNPYSVTTISLGLQEIISERLAVRLSFRDNPMSLGGALTITHKRLEFNISVQNNLPLGWVNRFEISFK